MGRTRQLKYEACLDEDLAQLTFEARLCFLLLPTIADREGRLEDRPMKISAQIFPYDSVDMEEILEQLAMPRQFSKGSFITRYETEDGCKYIQINNFHKHQSPHPKEKKSDIPALSEKAVKSKCISRKASELHSGSLSSGSSGSGAPTEPVRSASPRAAAVVRWEPKPTWRKGHPSLETAQLIVDPKHLAALVTGFPRVEGNGAGGGVEADIRKFKRHWLDNPSEARPKRDWRKTLTGWLKRTDQRFDDARFKGENARASPALASISGEHAHFLSQRPEVEIKACEAEHPEAHVAENLITSGERSLGRWCRFKCGFVERKT